MTKNVKAKLRSGAGKDLFKFEVTVMTADGRRKARES